MSSNGEKHNKKELYLINAIFGADILESFEIYFENKEILKYWRFIGCTNITQNKIKNIIHTKEVYNSYWLINLFKYKYIYFIEYKAAFNDTMNLSIKSRL